MISSQAAVLLRNVAPHTQSMLVASQSAIAAVSLEQVCYSKSISAHTVAGEKGRGKGRWRANVKTMVLCTYSAQRISQDIGRIPLVRRRSSRRLDGARDRTRRDTSWVRRHARRRQ